MAFRSLEDVYAGQCAGKPVVPLQRHVVTERYSITLKDADNVAVDQEITPDMFNKFRREVSRSTTVEIEGKQYTVNQVIDMILRLDAWDQGNPEYTEKFLVPVTGVFNHADINPDGFAALYKLQTDKNNKLRTELVQQPGVTKSLYALIPAAFSGAFKNPQDAQRVFDMLYNINPSIANVGVGRGEVALSFISDAIKGDKGDLEMSGLGEVEIKGDGARLGGDGHAVDRSIAAINSILELVGSSLSNVEIKQLKNELIAELNSIISSRENTIRSKVVVNALKNLANKIQQEASVDEITSDVQQAAPVLNQEIYKTLIKKINYIKKASIPSKVHTFTEAIRLFFSAVDQLPYEKFIDGVVSLRSYYAQNEISTIAAAVRSLIPESEYKSYNDPKKYEPLVVALHLVCYLLKEQFAYIVFLNDRSKDAICYQSQQDAASNLKASYKFFSRNNFKFKFSVDPTRKSVSVTFNG